MTKSIVLIAVVAAVMISSALAVTVTSTVFAAPNINHNNNIQGGKVGIFNGVNGGSNGHGAHDPCDNAGPAEHNPHCQ
jgi:opacity protein-like surface antigen